MLITTHIAMEGWGFGKVQGAHDSGSDPYWHSYEGLNFMAAHPRATEELIQSVSPADGYGEEPSWPEVRYFCGNDIY